MQKLGSLIEIVSIDPQLSLGHLRELGGHYQEKYVSRKGKCLLSVCLIAPFCQGLFSQLLQCDSAIWLGNVLFFLGDSANNAIFSEASVTANLLKLYLMRFTVGLLLSPLENKLRYTVGSIGK